MQDATIENELSAHAAAIRAIEPSPERVRAAVAKAHRASRVTRRRRSTRTLAVSFACLLLGAAAASASGVIGSPFDAFVDGGATPGRTLSAQELPVWLQPSSSFTPIDHPAVVAEDEGHQLIAYRQSGEICFEYDGSVGECGPPSYWQQEFADGPWILRGPTSGEGSLGFFGLGVDPAIVSVRVEYRTGPPTEARVQNGGFVVGLDPQRHPETLVGLDGTGGEVARSQAVSRQP